MLRLSGTPSATLSVLPGTCLERSSAPPEEHPLHEQGARRLENLDHQRRIELGSSFCVSARRGREKGLSRGSLAATLMPQVRLNRSPCRLLATRTGCGRRGRSTSAE